MSADRPLGDGLPPGDRASDRVSEPSPPEALPTAGADLVRAALAQARAAARSKGLQPGVPAKRRAAPPRSGSGPDARDPMLLGSAVRRLLAERGWQETAAAASVLGDWDGLVGTEIAQHCRPASLLDGELVLVAESTAWATQIRQLHHTLLARISEQVGSGVVTSVVVRGPAQPDWRKGPRRVVGRGPRDTYG